MSKAALSSVSVCPITDIHPSMVLTVPTFSNGNIVGNHSDTFIDFLEESFLVERNEYDLSGKLLWQVKRELAIFNEQKVLPQSSTVVYQDGTMVTSIREYNQDLNPTEERLYIDGVQQMCKYYTYKKGKLVAIDQTLFTIEGTFSKRQCDQLISRDGASYAKRQAFDANGKVIADYPEVASEELVTGGVHIEV